SRRSAHALHRRRPRDRRRAARPSSRTPCARRPSRGAACASAKTGRTWRAIVPTILTRDNGSGGTVRDHRRTTLGTHHLALYSRMMGYASVPKFSEGSLKPPIFLTSTFVFDSCADGKRFFEGITGKRVGGPEGLVYGRFNGPDQEILEDRLALWEGA